MKPEGPEISISELHGCLDNDNNDGFANKATINITRKRRCHRGHLRRPWLLLLVYYVYGSSCAYLCDGFCLPQSNVAAFLTTTTTRTCKHEYDLSHDVTTITTTLGRRRNHYKNNKLPSPPQSKSLLLLLLFQGGNCSSTPTTRRTTKHPLPSSSSSTFLFLESKSSSSSSSSKPSLSSSSSTTTTKQQSPPPPITATATTTTEDEDSYLFLRDMQPIYNTIITIVDILIVSYIIFQLSQRY